MEFVSSWLPTELRDSGLGKRGYQAGTSCTGKENQQGNTSFCIDTCLSLYVDNSTLARCHEDCDCKPWHRDSVDLLLGVLGGAAFCACCLVLCLDLFSSWSTRTPSQRECLKWSNICSLFYSIYFVAFAVADSYAPMWDGPCQLQTLFHGTMCDDNGTSPFCFLNCCIFAVPWLEFFGYGAYLWNVMWIFDLARFTQQPLAPEKVLGVPLTYFYHIFTWVCAGIIAFDPNGDRLVTDTCRQAKVVMMPCVLRRQNMNGDLAWFQVIGFVVIAMGFTILVIRYLDAGQLLMSSSRRCPRRERLLLAVRTYLRKQWLHFASLTMCSILILVDTIAVCDDEVGSYMTSAVFPGLGLLLSLDRLTSLAKEEGTPHFGSIDASPLSHQRSENMELGVSTANLRSLPPASEQSPFGAAGYRLLDFSALLEHLIHYLREEELQLAQQREFLAAGQTVTQAAASQLKLLRASAQLDESPDAAWDWTITAATGSDTTLTVIAPRSFTYLRRLAGLDCEALLTELLQTNVGGLKVAAKSGSSLLCSSDNRTFVLKTISKSEVKQVRAMLAEYRKHLEENPSSLLCRVYGCFSFKNSLGYFLHAVLMDCLVGLPASIADIAGFDCLTPSIFDMKSEFQDGGFKAAFPEISAGHQLCR